MRRTKVVLIGVLLVLLAACGNNDGSKKTAGSGSGGPTPTAKGACASAGTGHFAKTKFILHAGIAFGAFHRYIYKPYREGAFKPGAPGRTKALAKAAAAGATVALEIRNARKAAAEDPTLCKLVPSLDSLSGLVGSVAPGLGGGTFNPTQLLDLNSKIEQFKSNSGSSGVPIPER